jgi:hypothetical protein
MVTKSAQTNISRVISFLPGDEDRDASQNIGLFVIYQSDVAGRLSVLLHSVNMKLHIIYNNVLCAETAL